MEPDGGSGIATKQIPKGDLPAPSRSPALEGSGSSRGGMRGGASTAKLNAIRKKNQILREKNQKLKDQVHVHVVSWEEIYMGGHFSEFCSNFMFLRLWLLITPSC